MARETDQCDECGWKFDEETLILGEGDSFACAECGMLYRIVADEDEDDS